MWSSVKNVSLLLYTEYLEGKNRPLTDKSYCDKYDLTLRTLLKAAWTIGRGDRDSSAIQSCTDVLSKVEDLVGTSIVAEVKQRHALAKEEEKKKITRKRKRKEEKKSD